METAPIPDGLVVLTFDDGPKSQATVAAPLLQRYGFNATFYITEGLNFLSDKERYMTWEEVRQLDSDGFEIGNHTRHHKNVNGQTAAELMDDIAHIDQRCREWDIRRPQTFCYPGYSNGPEAVAVLQQRGFLFARRGVAPEYEYDGEGGRGPAYDPDKHHPLLVPTTGAAGPRWGFEDLVWAVDQARDGRICVLTFHGVPDLDHPWVHTDAGVFAQYMAYLHERSCTVIALRDLARYVDPKRIPAAA
ncbi:MAG: polysaccharide deacetylase family protein [Candidatus Latescibacteria bacterium]|nr:polysaccharide deacetylase family protein [Candidatus Latescibacterota bacterium]